MTLEFHVVPQKGLIYVDCYKSLIEQSWLYLCLYNQHQYRVRHKHKIMYHILLKKQMVNVHHVRSIIIIVKSMLVKINAEVEK